MNRRRRFRAKRRRRDRDARFRCVTGQHTPTLGTLKRAQSGYVFCRFCQARQRFSVTGPPGPWILPTLAFSKDAFHIAMYPIDVNDQRTIEDYLAGLPKKQEPVTIKWEPE